MLPKTKIAKDSLTVLDKGRFTVRTYALIGSCVQCRKTIGHVAR